MTQHRLRILTYLVMAYLLLGFLWWTVLLFTTNRDAARAKMELAQVGMAAEGLIDSPIDFYASPTYQQLRDDYQRQEWMIIGESLILILSVLGGMYIVYLGYAREIRTNQQQRNFLLSITHELKSPIAGIRLILETFKRRALTDPLREKLSSNGIQEADRLTKLVEDLLLSAKLESSYQLNSELLHLGEIVEEAFSVIQNKYPNTHFELDIAGDLPFMEGDAAGIHSLVINLVENAAKYSPPGSTVSVELQQNAAGDLFLIVADNGIGIPDREKKRVFEKFYRVGSEDTRQAKGTGLGLFIVRELVKRHNGNIQLLDNQPKGTRFEVVLPAV